MFDENNNENNNDSFFPGTDDRLESGGTLESESNNSVNQNPTVNVEDNVNQNPTVNVEDNIGQNPIENVGNTPDNPYREQQNSSLTEGTFLPNDPIKKRGPNKPSKKKKLFVLIVIIILLLAAIGFGIYTYKQNHPQIASTEQSFSSIGSDSSSSPLSSTNENPNWSSVANNVKKSVASIISSSESMFGESTAAGSGMIIDAGKGYILTNNHVVSGAQNLQVSLYNGEEYKASIVGTDPEDDLAVIKLEIIPKDLSAVQFADSKKVIVGQPVMAVGNPLGLDQTVTVGIISAINRPVTTAAESSSTQTNSYVVTNALQTDTAINPGNSGGPLFNGEGKVVGVNSSIASLSQSSSGESGNIGIGFSIPSNLASYVANALSKDGQVAHSLLGVTLKDDTVTVGNVSRSGGEVQSVVKNSAAGSAGLKKNDVIIGIDSYSTNSAISLTAFIRSYPPGTKVDLTFVRDGSTKKVQVTLKSK